jgi:Protein of unknown function (DUF3617)
MFRTHAFTASALSALGLISTLGYAAEPEVAMNVELGLWEVTTTGGASGTPAIPEALLQRMTPEQQAKMQQLLAQRVQGQKFKECMTAEKRSKGFGNKEEDGGKCKVTVTTNTPTEFQAQRQCAASSGDSTLTDYKMHFNITGKHHASGTIDIAITHQDGKVTNVHSALEAQWLGSDCGNVKNMELEK